MTPTLIEPSEHIAILELISRYARTFDAGDVEAFADLFTADATLETPVGTASSRVEIETWARERWIELRRDGIRPTHFQTNTILQSTTPGTASGTTQLLLVWHHADTDESKLTGVALYEDEFSKTDRGWQFHRRKIGWGGAREESR